MPDIRSMILDRLEDLLGNIDGAPASTVYRNNAAFPDSMRPCMVLLDGRQTTQTSREGRTGRVVSRSSPYIMRLEPQIFAVLKRRIPEQSGEYAQELTSYHNSMLRAILEDDDLKELTGANGDIIYRGMITDMESGRPMAGELQMQFVFYYPLNPSVL